jgi:hypothetical protein
MHSAERGKGTDACLSALPASRFQACASSALGLVPDNTITGLAVGTMTALAGIAYCATEYCRKALEGRAKRPHTAANGAVAVPTVRTNPPFLSKLWIALPAHLAALARPAKALYMSRAFGYRLGIRTGICASCAIRALRLAVQDTALSRR